MQESFQEPDEVLMQKQTCLLNRRLIDIFIMDLSGMNAPQCFGRGLLRRPLSAKQYVFE